MKQFIVDRHTTPNTPKLEQVPTEKIPIYENRAAVTADLANLSVGQIVATKDTGDELAQPVDVVEEGNLHAVSSNAVAESMSSDLTLIPQKLNPQGDLPFENYLGENEVFQIKGVANKTIVIDTYIYNAETTYILQIMRGTTDARVQAGSGYGRDAFTNIEYGTGIVDVWNNKYLHFRNTIQMGNSDVLGLKAIKLSWGYNITIQD